MLMFKFCLYFFSEVFMSIFVHDLTTKPTFKQAWIILMSLTFALEGNKWEAGRYKRPDVGKATSDSGWKGSHYRPAQENRHLTEGFKYGDYQKCKWLIYCTHVWSFAPQSCALSMFEGKYYISLIRPIQTSSSKISPHFCDFSLLFLNIQNNCLQKGNLI